MLGGVLWTGLWGLGIYFLGRRMVFVHLTFKRIESAMLVLALAGLAFLSAYLLWQRWSKKS
jgi:membrane protein DedA with SNARE-associated domain